MIKLVFENLEKLVKEFDEIVCEKMYNVLIMVGMVFVNVFLGICYLMVYKIGGKFYIIYGCINVILLLYVICYNGICLIKVVIWLKYINYVVDICF